MGLVFETGGFKFATGLNSFNAAEPAMGLV